jgi:hypothetical protein
LFFKKRIHWFEFNKRIVEQFRDLLRSYVPV